MAHLVLWDSRIVMDLFLGGLGIGAFLPAVYLYSRQREQRAAVMKQAALLAGIFVMGGAGMLMLELGKPSHIFAMMISFNPSSVTAWGSVFQGIFILASLSLFGLLRRGQRTGGMHAVFLGAAAVSGIALGFYHGFLLTSLGRGIWGGNLLTVVFFVSSLLAGGVLLIAWERVFFRKEKASLFTDKGIVQYLGLLAFVEMILVFLWVSALPMQGRETSEGMDFLLRSFGFLWWGGVVFCGLILPLVFMCYSLLKNAVITNGILLFLAGAIFIGSYALRYVIVFAGQGM